ncbi:hypothetical protein CGLO_02452 [Colletotrichum gloeosporioides Cg-14]|uniref:Uncharacterized protein n=1 Tax=Colletotrichum gloeosporioides (strain Cg-14) TaxID=1237896 RepID=T0M0V9_COLGC|nr:hypothetical protein CGLO_02452 [Colletotrichum gloeosporioides Cg-14]
MADACHNNGDGDLYGIGVRIGLYLQWFAGLLLRNHHSSWQTISTVRATNNVLGISITVASIVNTSRGLTLVTDFLLTYYLTIALFYSESYNLLSKPEETAPRDGKIKRYYFLQPDVPLLLQNFLFATASLFGAWFWIRGVSGTAQLECGPAKAAVIVSFNLHSSHWTAFAATMSILVGGIFTFFFVGHLYIFCTGEVRSEPLVAVAGLLAPVSNRHALMGPNSQQGNRSQDLEILLRPGWYDFGQGSSTFGTLVRDSWSLLHLFIINLAGPIVAIASVEVMIRENHILTDGIFESTGQMIALAAAQHSL